MSCRPAISSHSLGRAWVHDMRSKLDQAAKYGLDIELFYEDLEYLAASLPGGLTPTNLRVAARRIRSMCDERDIAIVCLQPFMHYEGLRDRQQHAQKIEDMKSWIQLAKILRTDVISIPSTCLSEAAVSGDVDVIVQDLQEVADLAARDGLQLAYEALAWGTHTDTWEQAWQIVQAVDRHNFGICLDTFNIAARVYGDPTSPDRRTPHAEEEMRLSLERLVRTIDVRKILYVQVVDAEWLESPLVEGHPHYDPEQPPRMSWSRHCRLFYGEQNLGGYLPIAMILKAILEDLGFEGWVSAELFNDSLTDADPSVPEQHAERAFESWQKILRDFRIKRPETTRLRGHKSGYFSLLEVAQL